MKLIAQAHVLNDDVVAVLDIDPEEAKVLLAMMEQAAGLRATDPGLAHMVYYDGAVSWHDPLWDSDDDALEAMAERIETEWRDDDRIADWLGARAAQDDTTVRRTERDYLYVAPGCVWWESTDKYSDAQYETPRIAAEELQALAAGRDPFNSEEAG